jgi:hypothetical protein
VYLHRSEECAYKKRAKGLLRGCERSSTARARARRLFLRGCAAQPLWHSTRTKSQEGARSHFLPASLSFRRSLSLPSSFLSLLPSPPLPSLRSCLPPSLPPSLPARPPSLPSTPLGIRTCAQVIEHIVRDLNMDITVNIVPTRREADGLAMSSRNAYLRCAESAVHHP